MNLLSDVLDSIDFLCTEILLEAMMEVLINNKLKAAPDHWEFKGVILAIPPCLRMIEAVLASFQRVDGLAECPLIIVCDGS